MDRFGSAGRDLTSRFRGLRATDVPYGAYDYSLKHPGYPYLLPARGHVIVSAPEHLLVVTLSRQQLTGASIDGAPEPGFIIRGRLEPAPHVSSSEAPVWVRLQAVFKAFWPWRDVPVDASGDFRIYEPLDGNYLLTVIRGEEILHVQPVSFEQMLRGGSFTVRMPIQSPQIVRVVPDRK